MSDDDSASSNESVSVDEIVQKLEKKVKHFEKKLGDSENQRKRLEQRYDNQSQLFDKTVAELDASRALIGEQFRKIESILTNINQGIIVVDGNLRIDDQMSRAIHSVVGRQIPSGAHLIKDILDHTNLTADDKSKVITVVSASVGENQLNYELNSDSMPKEVKMENGARILEIDWNPTLKEDTVENIIVCIRDVTQIRTLQEKAKIIADHISNIIEIVENDPKEVNNFIKRCKVMIEENDRVGDQEDKPIEERIEVMFRNAHTIKGSARIYRLSKIVNAVHELESKYQEVRNKRAEYQSGVFKAELEECRRAVSIYEDVLVQKLHFEEKEGGDEDRIYAIIARMDIASESERNGLWKDLLKEYKLRAYHAISRILSPVVRSVADIAAELQKPCPDVNINGGNIMIHGDINNLLVDSFTHLVRNSLDHGIEPATSREEIGKKRAGTVKIWLAYKEGSEFGSIFLEDDGRGLNLPKLRTMAPSGGQMTDDQVAEIIFASGVSTATEVSGISGRGVGMNAVREALKEVGGDIKIEFTSAAQVNGFRSFRFNLRLPSKYFLLKDNAVK